MRAEADGLAVSVSSPVKDPDDHEAVLETQPPYRKNRERGQPSKIDWRGMRVRLVEARMFGPWFNFVMLAAESQQVIALRLAKLAYGGMNSYDEAYLMCAEKIAEARAAAISLQGGASMDSIVMAYRSVVQANVARLSALPQHEAGGVGRHPTEVYRQS